MSDAMSIDGVHANDGVEWQELFNSKKSSDMDLILPGPKCKTIHAHKSILAATSGLLDGVAKNADTFELRKDYGPDSYEFVIKYMYGYKLTGLGEGLILPHTLYKLAGVAQIAKLWEVTGLVELVSEAADRALVEILSDEYKLQEFLYIQIWEDCKRGRVSYSLSHKILGKHLAELNKSPSFRKMIRLRPNLAVDILLAME